MAGVVTQLWGDNATGVPPTQTLGGRVPPVPPGLTPLIVMHSQRTYNTLAFYSPVVTL